MTAGDALCLSGHGGPGGGRYPTARPAITSPNQNPNQNTNQNPHAATQLNTQRSPAARLLSGAPPPRLVPSMRGKAEAAGRASLSAHPINDVL